MIQLVDGADGLILQGDCLDVLKELEDNSVDSIVTDPPYELGFMGKKWDNTGIAYNVELWKECLRVLKPGGHLLAFSGTRTYHRMASAIEDAGFEVRDMIEWVYGSGFPKSLNIGKAVDKLNGIERKIIGYKEPFGREGRNTKPTGNYNAGLGGNYTEDTKDLRPIYDSTSEWEGWGTALKPAHEPIVMARKPLAEKTVAENVLKYGTGGINIDENRVGTEGGTKHEEGEKEYKNEIYGKGLYKDFGKVIHNLGRFPANLIHDNSEEVRECFPETKSGKMGPQHTRHTDGSPNGIYGKFDVNHELGETYGDSGNASRFFKSIIYQAKASKSERNMGCDGLEEKQYSYDGRNKEIENPYQRNKSLATNNHPTVKPVALMEYLIKMVTVKGGVVLDCFAGSGTTLVASKRLGYKYIGIEMIEEYIQIIKARLKATEVKE